MLIFFFFCSLPPKKERAYEGLHLKAGRQRRDSKDGHHKCRPKTHQSGAYLGHRFMRGEDDRFFLQQVLLTFETKSEAFRGVAVIVLSSTYKEGSADKSRQSPLCVISWSGMGGISVRCLFVVGGGGWFLLLVFTCLLYEKGG